MHIKNSFVFLLMFNTGLFLSNFVFSITSHINTYDAEIILSERKVFVENNGFMKTVIHKIIKVNNYEGIEKFKYFTINYDKDYDEIIINRIYRIFPDGTKEEIDTSHLYEEKQNSNTKIINLPIEKPNDIIEYEIIVNKKPLFENHFFNTYVFEDIVPIKKSFFSITLPQNKEIYYILHNIDLTPVIETENNLKTYIFSLENIRAIPITTNENLLPETKLKRIVVSSVATWDKIAEWFSKIFTQKRLENEKVKSKISQIIRDKNLTKEEVIKKLFSFVAYKITTKKNKDSESNLIPNSANETLHLKYASCKDKVVLLLALLYEVNIKAYPVLLQTHLQIKLEEEVTHTLLL